MRVVVQRVKSASVAVDTELIGSIGVGLMVLVGFEEGDDDDDINWMAAKLSRLRLFDDADGIMNLSIQDVDGQFLIVSQFTLHAKTKKGNRPSYIKAAHPDIAIPLYNSFVQRLKSESGRRVEVGVFGANMLVKLENDGPVTIFIDTKNKE
ncbi:MAG: D-aminoacyl-tRNA deacylase [Bacteroidales bacterium]|jgi:D-tyrosyl-tRNA(Tyr) deacylase|nr:D-aminoacyl-tRNA deacylase [Bacteroidales bacterium]MDD4384685.1 D-aminoacyl-tRNA deacylase [Bacteroidales bacterium]MDY0197060.1 D-aminoacyl-tRNA deacylase [Tenuifilaceae bacterium]